MWVEAIEATDGDPNRPDSAGGDHSGQIPDEKIILRYTAAIAEKHRKFDGYRNDGIAMKGDSCVIAINGYALNYRWADPEIPRILKAVFPLGAYEFIIDRVTGKVVDRGHRFRGAITKASGAEIPTGLFLDIAYADISAIILSYANAAMKQPLGSGSIAIHNPLAACPVSLGTLPCSTEYQAKQVDADNWELSSCAGVIP